MTLMTPNPIIGVTRARVTVLTGSPVISVMEAPGRASPPARRLSTGTDGALGRGED
jgi:hypothetical protein